MQSKQVTDLRSEIKKWMFGPDKSPVVLSKDNAKISLVMSAFNNYEKTVRKRGWGREGRREG